MLAANSSLHGVFQTISGSGLKPMTVPNLPQETCRVRTWREAHGRAMCRYLRRDAAIRGWARSLGCEKKEPTMFAYKGSTAMITGASKGLGAAFAKELAGRGMNLVLIARSIDTLQDLADSRPPHLAGARSEKVRC